MLQSCIQAGFIQSIWTGSTDIMVAIADIFHEEKTYVCPKAGPIETQGLGMVGAMVRVSLL